MFHSGGTEPITFHLEVNYFAILAKWKEARGKMFL